MEATELRHSRHYLQHVDAKTEANSATSRRIEWARRPLTCWKRITSWSWARFNVAPNKL